MNIRLFFALGLLLGGGVVALWYTPASKRFDTAPTHLPRRILVDLGANCGNSYAHLTEKEAAKFDMVWLIEPQTAVVNRWLAPLRSPTVHVVNAAVSDHDADEAPFFVDAPYASDHCTLDKGYPHGASSLQAQAATVDGVTPAAHSVRVIDIALFLRKVARPEDHVLLKVDVEGGEEAILRRLLDEGLLYRLVDDLRVEWHESTRAYQAVFEASVFRYGLWMY